MPWFVKIYFHWKNIELVVSSITYYHLFNACYIVTHDTVTLLLLSMNTGFQGLPKTDCYVLFMMTTNASLNQSMQENDNLIFGLIKFTIWNITAKT